MEIQVTLPEYTLDLFIFLSERDQMHQTNFL